jgi:hypothetical protein
LDIKTYDDEKWDKLTQIQTKIATPVIETHNLKSKTTEVLVPELPTANVCYDLPKNQLGNQSKKTLRIAAKVIF